MLIIHGTKITRHHLGFAADFCPICRDVSPFGIQTVKRVRHLYYIPMGSGELTHHELQCHRCESEYASKKPAYTRYLRFPDMEVADLAAQTNPDLLDRVGARLDLETRLHELGPDERAALIAEPIDALTYMAAKIKSAGTIPTGAGVAIIAILFIIPVVIVLWNDPKAQITTGILAGLGLLLLMYTIRSIMRASRDPGKLLPLLAQALAPLQPTTDELANALQRAAARGQFIAKRISPTDLFAAIAKLSSTSPVPA